MTLTLIQGAYIADMPSAEKIPYLLGTLVMSLPSPHSGGGINVTAFGKKKVLGRNEPPTVCTYWYVHLWTLLLFSFPLFPPSHFLFSSTFVLFVTVVILNIHNSRRALEDVSHEALPVVTGYKWVLTYNLTTMSPLENLPQTENPSLHEAFMAWATNLEWCGRWKRNDTKERASPLCYTLDNRYLANNLHLKGLQYRDKALVRQLKGICRKFEFELFLASLELAISAVTTQERLDDYYANGKAGQIAEGYTSWTLKAEGVRDLDGNELLPSVDINDRWLLGGMKQSRKRPDACEKGDPIVYAGHPVSLSQPVEKNTVLTSARRSPWCFGIGFRFVTQCLLCCL